MARVRRLRLRRRDGDRIGRRAYLCRVQSFRLFINIRVNDERDFVEAKTSASARIPRTAKPNDSD